MMYYDPSWIQGTTLYGTLLDEGKIVFETPEYQYDVDSDVDSVMEMIREQVSEPMYELLMQMLLPFSKGVQLDMADDLLAFACGHVIHTTGCLSADAVLKACYSWIAAERGIDLSKLSY